MRKILVLSLILLTAVATKAQNYFEVVPGGFKDIKTGKSFVVIDAPGKDSIQIYNDVMSQINTIFDKPDEAIIAKQPYSFIKLYGIQPKSLDDFDFKYNIIIDIKKEKYRISFQIVDIYKIYPSEERHLKVDNGTNDPLDKSLHYIFKDDKPRFVYTIVYSDLGKWVNYLTSLLDIRKIEKQKDNDW